MTVYAADNSTVSNTTVTYASTDSAIATVNDNGLVTAGFIGGIATITASAGGISSNPVTVIVYDHTLVGVPSHIVKVEDVGTPAVATSVHVKVKVIDAYGATLAGTPVTFAVTSGNGAVVPASTVTDGTGTLGATWTIGTSIYTSNTLVATAGGLQAIFTCNPTPGPAVSAWMFAPYYGLPVGTQTQFLLSMQDAYGNVSDATSASFISRDPSVITFQSNDAPGRATFHAAVSGQTYIVGSVNGIADSSLVVVFRANGVLVSAQAPRFDLKTDTTFSTIVQLNTGPSTPGIGSVTVTVTWDPTTLTYVSDVEDYGGPNATVNRTNVANGSLTLAVATSASLGAVPLRDITFKAASTAGRSGAITVTVPDIADNNFTSLLPVTQTLSFPVRTR